MTRWRTRRRGSRRDRGAAAVEFAIVLTVLLLIIFAIIDFGRLLFVSQAVKSASREGARAAVVATGTQQRVYESALSSGGSAAGMAGATPPNAPAVTATVGAGLPITLTGSTSTTRVCPTTGNSAVTVTVRVAPFRWFTPVGLIANSVNSVEASTTMRCE